MSVKRRLFISNFLMLVLPIVLMVLTSLGLVLIYTGVTGVREAPPLKNIEVFFRRLELVESLAQQRSEGEGWDEIKMSIDQFNREHEATGLMLSLYDGQGLVYPASQPQEELAAIDLSQASKFLLMTEEMAVYKVTAEDHALVLTDTHFFNPDGGEPEQRIYGGIILLATLIIIVVATNRVLTQFVFRSIMNPIQILVHGVHQLRDGNLTYRIQYSKKDEFAVVCAEFNAMAQRLSMIVNERQKDEANRRELIAGISHDLRTPLTSIKAYLEGIEKGVASTPQMQRKYFETIKNKTASLEHLINQLFLFSKLDIGEFPLHLERVEIGQELQKMMAAFAAEYDAKGLGIQVDNRIDNRIEQAEVLIDVVQFRNVMQNVLENSLKYKDKERADVRVVVVDKSEQVEIRLTDNGPGVAEEELDKLFDVFYRSDASRKTPDLGSGLGLAISSKVIQRLGGQIRAELAPGGGLAIIVTLPKHSETEGAANEENFDY